MNKIPPAVPKRLNIINIHKIVGELKVPTDKKGISDPYRITHVTESDDYYFFQIKHDLTNNLGVVKLCRKGNWEYNSRLHKYTFFYSFFGKAIKVSADYISDMENLRGSIVSYIKKSNN